MTARTKKLIFAIAPTSRGFGFVLFSAPATPLDWGVKETRWDKNRQAKSKIEAMLREIKPAVVVIENWLHASCRRSEWVRVLLNEVAVLAHKGGATAMIYSRWHIYRTFRMKGKSKDAIAAAIAEEVPALRPWLPPRRRIWESEHHSMAIFEAAALAMVHYGTLRSYKEAQDDQSLPL